jgi:homoserine O-acetyltransferase
MPILDIGSVTLRSGVVLPSVQVAYTSQGRLAPHGRNAILVTHGFTSAHTMIEPGHHVAEGSWVPIIGPGLPLDTDRWFIVCSNMLGSAAGTTGPRSINPATGKPWGPDFPDITLEDIVAVQHRLLQALGVRHLRAVMGPSYGGWQALQWALDHPGMVDAIGVIASDFRHPPGQSKAAEIAKLAQSPQWHGGWYYDKGGMEATLLALRLKTLSPTGWKRCTCSATRTRSSGAPRWRRRHAPGPRSSMPTAWWCCPARRSTSTCSAASKRSERAP